LACPSGAVLTIFARGLKTAIKLQSCSVALVCSLLRAEHGGLQRSLLILFDAFDKLRTVGMAYNSLIELKFHGLVV